MRILRLGTGPGLPAGRPLARRLLSRREDDGFTLLESLISITLITVVMGALGMFFVTVVQNLGHNRQAQVAAQLANGALDKVRQIGAASAISGRTEASVEFQLSSEYENGLSTASSLWTHYLNTSTAPPLWDPAYDPTARSDAGAHLPTGAVAQPVGGTTYKTHYYVGYCWRTTATNSGDCVGQKPVAASVEYVRVLVAVTWSGTNCPRWGCLQDSSTLLNGDNDPLFNFDQQPPPTPAITTPGSQTGDVGSPVYGVKSSSCTPSPTTVCRVSATGGVPQYVFSAHNLPPGLVMSGDGLVTGTPTQTGTWSNVTVTVTDAFLSQKTTSTFSWQIYSSISVTPAGGTAGAPLPNQAAQVDVSIGTLTLATASGGSGNLTWSDPSNTLSSFELSLVSGTGATLKVTGTPANPGDHKVMLTVTDTTTGATNQVSFVWSVGGLVIVDPGVQTGTEGDAFAVSLTAHGGQGPFTWSVLGLSPTGLTATVAGSTGSATLTGTPTATGTYTVTVKVTDSSPTPLTATRGITVKVYGPPTIGVPSGQITTVGLGVSLPVSYHCESADCTLALSGAPSWLRLSSTTITDEDGSVTLAQTSGSSMIAGTSRVAVTITQGATSVSGSFGLTVYSAPTVTVADQLKPPTNPQTYQVVANCPNNPGNSDPNGAGPCTAFTLSWVGHTDHPSWLTIDNSGLITATTTTPASAVGLYVTVTDAAGDNIKSDNFAWTADTPPTVDLASQNQLTAQGTRTCTKYSYSGSCSAYSPYTLTNALAPTKSGCTSGSSYCVLCPGGSCTYALKDVNLPSSWSSLVVDSNTGVLTLITPTYATGTATAKLTVTDQYNQSAAVPLSWTLTELAAPPTVHAANGVSFAYPLQYLCQSGTCSLTATGLPDGLTLAHGVISGVPQVSATLPATITAQIRLTDGSSTSTASVPIQVVGSLSATQPVVLFDTSSGACAYWNGTSVRADNAAGCVANSAVDNYTFEFGNVSGGAIQAVGAGKCSLLGTGTQHGSGSSTYYTASVTLGSCTGATTWTFNASGAITATSGTHTYALSLGSSLSAASNATDTWGISW